MAMLNSRDLLLGLVGLYLAYKLFLRTRRNAFSTPLRGPPSSSLLVGVIRDIINSDDPGAIYEDWAATYGSVYSIPRGLGRSKVILCDPKALAHFHVKDTFTYTQSPLSKRFLDRMVGNGILSAQGEDHRRQRRALTPAFSNASLRRLTNVFFDTAHKVKSHWENILEGKEGIIEVQEWMNHVALDSIGLGGFSHAFNSIDGEKTSLVNNLQLFSEDKGSKFHRAVFLIMQLFPWATAIPTARNRALAQFKVHATEIANEVLERARKEKEGGSFSDNSIIGLLVKSESAGSAELRTNPEEVMAQNTLVLAGYETSSTILSYALVQLCKNVKAQSKLREELEKFGGQDPTWDDLMFKLPYLDAVVQETLRLHPPVQETQRVAAEDDIIPLSQPIVTRDGKETTSIAIKKGTAISSPIISINRSATFWGPTAKEFIPERWLNLDESDVKAKEILGYRHLLTFSDGPRICLGKNFALAEIKSVLSVLIRYFSFELPGGEDQELSFHQALVRRPTLKGMDGAKLPLKVKKVEY